MTFQGKIAAAVVFAFGVTLLLFALLGPRRDPLFQAGTR
jgi:hypothetical protein